MISLLEQRQEKIAFVTLDNHQLAIVYSSEWMDVATWPVYVLYAGRACTQELYKTQRWLQVQW